MITLVGRAPHVGGLIGTGGGIRVAGGTTVPVVGSWSRPSGILVPVAGRDGTSISIGGTVATYAELPVLSASDKGTLYVVQADGLGYVWSGTGWPADGAGIEIRGEKGDRGLGIASIAVVGDSLRMLMTDGSVETVAVPALEAAAASALAAAGSASAASGSASAAAGSATSADTHRAAAAGSATTAAGSATAAGTSASNAATSATSSASSATLAGQHKTAAESSKTAAATSATSAAGSASAAATSATEASTARTDAQTAATAAAGSESAAATSATAASTDADRAEAAAESAETGAPDGGWTIPTLAADVHQQLPLSVGVDAAGNIDNAAAGGRPLESFLDAARVIFDLVAAQMIPFVEDALADLVGAAPETLDTLAEIAEALGGDPNLAANLTAAIGERAKTVDVDAALALKAAIGHTHTAASIGAVTAPASGLTIWRGTNAAYTAIGTKDPNTLYLRLP